MLSNHISHCAGAADLCERLQKCFALEILLSVLAKTVHAAVSLQKKSRKQPKNGGILKACQRKEDKHLLPLLFFVLRHDLGDLQVAITCPVK